jgi:Protein of unknown function (DUF3309)
VSNFAQTRLNRRGQNVFQQAWSGATHAGSLSPTPSQWSGVDRTGTWNEKDGTMSLGLILVIILVIFLLGGFSGRFGGYGYGYGHGGVGVIGIVLIVLVVLLLMGRL